MSILAQIIGLACLLFWGFWLCCKLRLPAGFAPLCGLCFCMVVLQLAGSCNQLWLGAQLLLVGAVLTLAQRRRHEILPQLLSPGVLAFCSAAGVLMAVFAIRQPEFQTWDEFSHWGIYFKSVFYQHRFAVWDTTRSLAHQAYPQSLPGLYALFALPAAQYREADVLFVTALPLAAAASALFALPQVTARRPRIAYTVCACLAAPALFWLFAPDTPYTTAYMDAPVGALFAAALCVILLPCAANSRVQRGLALALLCGALTTVKEIGTVFALCVVGIWFLQCLLDALRDRGGILRGFLLPFTAALPCFAIPLAWKLLLKALHRADDQFSSMGPGYFLQCWQEARTGFDRYFYDVWDRYYARLRSYPLLFGASTFKVGCLCAAAAVLLLIVLIWAMGRWQGLRTALPGLCMILYWPLYQGVLFYVYICGMSPYEALEMASWERYFCCFFLGWFSVLEGEALLAGFAAAHRLPRMAGHAVPAIVPCLLVCSTLWGIWQAGGAASLFCLPKADWRTEQQQIAADMLTRMDGAQNGSIWLLSADDSMAVQNMWYYQYELYPAVTAVEAQSSETDVDLGYNIGEHDVTWLVLFGVTDDFTARYADLADDGLHGQHIVDQAGRLAAADDAAVFHVRVLEEHLAGRLSGHVLGHILEFAAGLLLGKDALGDFALIHARGVLERAQKQDRLHLVGVLDEVVFHGREHGALLRQQEAGAHVHAFGAEHERGCHLAAGRNAAGADDRNVKRLHTARREHHGAEIVLARVAGALKAVGDDHVRAERLRLERVLDGGALVDEHHAGVLDGAHHVVLRRAAGGLHDLDALFGADADVARIVRHDERRHEREVDGKGLARHGLDLADLRLQLIGRGKRARRQQPQAAGLRHGGDQRCAGNPLHAALHDGVFDPQHFGKFGTDHRYYLLKYSRVPLCGVWLFVISQ